MPRTRNVKPGLFKNDVLAECSFSTRYLFVGLWTLADRDGRLEDRPRKIKMELLPADDVDVDAALDDLAARGFIQRYEIGGCQYIQVVKFDKHQTPHKQEAASTIPAPDKHQTSTRQARDDISLVACSSLLELELELEPGTTGPGECEGADAPAASAADPPAIPAGIISVEENGETHPSPAPSPSPSESKARTAKQIANDQLHERRDALFRAYCVGVGIRSGSVAEQQARDRSYRELKPALAADDLSPPELERLSRYAKAAYSWRHGKATPSVGEVLAASAEWDELGRPEAPPPKPSTSGRPRSRSDQARDELAELQRIGGIT